MDPASEPSASVAFGRFRVLPQRRELFADGRPLKLGARALDILIALIEARGAVVSKDALMKRVWPDRVAEANNLQTHVVALRKALGAERGLIRTVSGRGYQFTGEIRILSVIPEQAGAGVAAAEPAPVLPPTNIPEPVFELIGREEELSEILNLVTTHRLVTLTGAGGIGKTTLALALAHELRPHFADGVWLAEFSALGDPGLIPATVAAAVGLELGAGEASAQPSGAGARRPARVAGAGYLRACGRCRRRDGRGDAGGRLGAAYHRHQPRATPSGGRMGLSGTAAPRAGGGYRG